MMVIIVVRKQKTQSNFEERNLKRLILNQELDYLDLDCRKITYQLRPK